MRSTQLAVIVPVAFVLAAIAGSGCRETPLVPDSNQTPIADAQFINAVGMSVDEVVGKGMDPNALIIPFNGQPVAVTLNGSASKDDGKITKYQWLSGDKGMATGPKRGMDPMDIAQPVVTLGQGTFTFVLWVTDDQGVVSQPNSVMLTVGAIDPANDPAVLECASNVLDMVTDPCKMCICTQNADCRAKVVETACDENCWGLISCIATNCPNFAAMAAMMDYSCFTAAGCTAFIAGQTAATAAGPCITPCAAMCRSAMPMPAADAGM